MIAISDSAQQYFEKLIEQQDIEDLGLRIDVKNAGLPTADCQLSFCESGQSSATDESQQCSGFTLFIDKKSLPYLTDASFDYEQSNTGGQLVIKAPNIRGLKPGEGANLQERVQYVIDSEVNPMIASHGGVITLLDITEDKEVLIRFGGGCQGCGMANVTLKDGVEKTILERLPEIKAVKDVTDHGSGENPYY